MSYAHVGFAVKDLAVSKKFYEAALAPVGITLISEGENWAAFGKEGRNLLWIGTFGPVPGHIHFAFEASDRSSVDAFYKAAIAAGGKDNGAPGIRENYSPTYYAAFVIDPDGHNVEVVAR